MGLAACARSIAPREELLRFDSVEIIKFADDGLFIKDRVPGTIIGIDGAGLVVTT